jgi:hypothetical protein
MPMLYTNVEVMDMQFFTETAAVQQFLHASDGADADFGIYRYRWGDAPLRAMLLGMLATPDQVYQLTEFDYVHPSDPKHMKQDPEPEVQ